MARFVFQLEGVLRHRRNVELERQRDVAKVQAQMTALDAQLRALDAEVTAATDDVRQNRLVGKIDLQFLAAHRRYQAATQRKAMEIVERMGAVQVQLNEARGRLAEAAKERKVIEKLRERQEEAWRAELRRKEAAVTDEIAMQMTYRKMLAAEDR